VDNQYIVATFHNFFLYFASILYEAMPWVVLGAVLAGIVQEIPPRRAPAVMLALSAIIVTLFVSPFGIAAAHGYVSLAPVAVTVCDWVFALALGAAVFAGLVALQPAVDRSMGFLGRRRYLSIVLCGLLGLVIPMCECGIIPLTRRLLRKGLPISCCVTFILSGPIINVVVLMTTYVAFASREAQATTSGPAAFQMGGLMMLGCRALLGFIVAVLTGFVAERLARKYGAALLTGMASDKKAMGQEEEVREDEADQDFSALPWRKRLGNITDTALHDFVDITVFLIVGALIAAAAKVAISPDQIEQVSRNRPTLAIGIMMAFAFVVTLCSEADAFVAANFVTLRPAAKLAFLVLGPMLDFKLLFMYTRIFRPRLMWTIIVCVVLQVFVYSYIVHHLWEAHADRERAKVSAVEKPE
jgi:uncharacterized membrane protein YraQ (UPF0718 family)